MKRDLLCRFRYFGVPDDVDYRNIPWRNSRFDTEELTTHVATQSRAQNALDQLRRRGGTRTIAFCISQRHADFMAGFFRDAGLRAVAVHSGDTSAPRAQSLEELSAGHLDVLCAVDIFNEGLDLPELDTVLMLRPTESRVLWLQQFGRGLRKSHDDKRLTVIDYIGNHRTFLLKPQTLFSLPSGGQPVLNMLERLKEGPVEIAPGCEVTYELETIDILRGLIRVTANKEEALKRYYEEFVELQGARPRAAEAFHEGYNPRAARAAHGSWLGFVRAQGGLDESQAATFDRHQAFLSELDDTQMTKSYKMLVLLAMLNEDAFPGEITIDSLAEAVRALASRNHLLVTDLGPRAATPAGLKRHLEENPIKAWTEGFRRPAWPHLLARNPRQERQGHGFPVQGPLPQPDGLPVGKPEPHPAGGRPRAVDQDPPGARRRGPPLRPQDRQDRRARRRPVHLLRRRRFHGLGGRTAHQGSLATPRTRAGSVTRRSRRKSAEP